MTSTDLGVVIVVVTVGGGGGVGMCVLTHTFKGIYVGPEGHVVSLPQSFSTHFFFDTESLIGPECYQVDCVWLASEHLVIPVSASHLNHS